MSSFLFYTILGILGTLFGSFANVLIWRWKNHIRGITTGRSQCRQCNNKLSGHELIPIFSYILQKWKCRSCWGSISLQYPIVEWLMAVVFCLMWYVAIEWHIHPISFSMFMLLFWWFVTVVYAVYDAIYTEVPDKIFIIWYISIFILFILWFIFHYYNWIPDLQFFHTFHTYAIDHIRGAWILYTFVFLQILIPWGIHLLQKKQYHDLVWLLGQYILFPILVIWETLFPKKNTSPSASNSDWDEIPMWIGPGDLLIALFIGLTIGTLHGITSFFFAYLSGSLVGIFLLIRAKIKQIPFSHEIAFGPFLAFWWIVSIVWYKDILAIWTSYMSLFL